MRTLNILFFSLFYFSGAALLFSQNVNNANTISNSEEASQQSNPPKDAQYVGEKSSAYSSSQEIKKQEIAPANAPVVGTKVLKANEQNNQIPKQHPAPANSEVVGTKVQHIKTQVPNK